MAILKATCDDCGKELNADEVIHDYDGKDRCDSCDAKSDIYVLQRQLKEAEIRLEHQRVQLEQIQGKISVLQKRVKT